MAVEAGLFVNAERLWRDGLVFFGDQDDYVKPNFERFIN